MLLYFLAIKKCCSIAGLFNHSSNFKEALYDAQKRNGKEQAALIQHVSTRWNSFYLMLKSVSVNNKIMETLLDNKEYRKYALAQDEIELIDSCCIIWERCISAP